MSDAEFERFVQREAADYNAPPVTVPREEMWQAISAARGPSRNSGYRWWLAMAATLVIGVAIGRFALQSGSGESATIASNGTSADASGMGYRVTSAQHLERAEALLTAVRASGGRAGDAQLGEWTRDLLSNTRLLLDSPAGADPARRKLLEDLELVLVQLVQTTPATAPEAGADRAYVNRSLDRTQVLPRLRAALSAEPVRGT